MLTGATTGTRRPPLGSARQSERPGASKQDGDGDAQARIAIPENSAPLSNVTIVGPHRDVAVTGIWGRGCRASPPYR
jgi:hypothetical protein